MQKNGLEGLDEIYQDVLLDHYRSPRNHQVLQVFDLKAEGFNPFCGDRMVITARVDDSGHITEVGFQGQGCVISQASTSMMTELLKGLTLEEATELLHRFKDLMHGKELNEKEEEAMGDLPALKGVCKFPVRVKCAVLGWSALQDAIEQYKREHPARAS